MKLFLFALLSLSQFTGVLVRRAGPSGDFTLSLSSSLSVAQGSSTTLTVTTGGFSGVILATVTSGLPAGVTASSCSSSLIGSASCDFTLTASSVATVGTSTVTVTAISGGQSHTATSSLTVSGDAPPEAQLTVVTSSLTSGTTVNLTAGSPLGWVFYGQDSAAHDINGNSPDCAAGTLNNTQTPCTPGAAKLGGSGITPLYVTIPSGDKRIYFNYGPNMPNLGWSWTDSSGYSATGKSSQLYQVPNGGSTMQIALESDPIIKEATIYVNDWSGNASGGCNSGAGTLHATFHAVDGSFADQIIPLVSVEGDCSGAFKLVATFATAVSSYITVTVDQSSSGGGASLIAASLRIP